MAGKVSWWKVKKCKYSPTGMSKEKVLHAPGPPQGCGATNLPVSSICARSYRGLTRATEAKCVGCVAQAPPERNRRAPPGVNSPQVNSLSLPPMQGGGTALQAKVQHLSQNGYGYSLSLCLCLSFFISFIVLLLVSLFLEFFVVVCSFCLALLLSFFVLCLCHYCSRSVSFSLCRFYVVPFPSR